MDGAPGRRAPLPGRADPAVAGALALAIGLANALRALAPRLDGRLGMLRHAHHVPDDVLFAHRLELPVGLALVVAAFYLARRRRGALWTTVGLLAVVGAMGVVKGAALDALVPLGVAAALVRSREAFCVRFNPVGVPWTAATLVAAVGCGWLLLAAGAPWEDAPLGGPRGELHDALGLLSLLGAPARYHGAARHLPHAVAAIGVLAFLRIAWLVGRRPRPPAARLPADAVARVVREHGRDTLSAFKLRTDLDHLRSAGGDGLLSYRVVAGVLLVAGDPVGPPETLVPLLAAARERARTLGLRLGVLGASDEVAAAAREIGLRSLYIGDEAIVDTAGFSLDGHAIKKVRQAVRRLQRHGYALALHAHGDLADAELDEIERLCERARGGAPERGFAMALDGLRGEHLADSWLAVARDAHGAARGVLHFTPTYGRAAASLGFMRRDAGTPNGLVDFLVVGAIQALAERGVAEASLNFAAFGRLLRAPASRRERLAGRLVVRGDRFLQLESLYRFNRKFGPRWVPRHLVYEGPLALPRTALAAMAAEGQFGLARSRWRSVRGGLETPRAGRRKAREVLL